MNQQFRDALQNHSIPDLQTILKSDLHNHAGRGGSIQYIEAWANVRIEPPVQPFDSLSEMQHWFENNIKCHCAGIQGYLKRIEASFAQAAKDHIKVLALSFGIDEIDSLGNMDAFIGIMNELHMRFAPNTDFFPELALGRESKIDVVFARIDEIFSYKWFKSVDICNDEFAQPIRNFKSIYRRAKASGLRLKAHVGEFGSADDVMEAVEELELNEVHHGIAAAGSVQIMNWLADHKIQLNVCPTSNIMLKRVDRYANHPIRKLYDHSVPVTINTDDLLILNQSVSQEYLNLFDAKLMTADELDTIREVGLRYG